jgi:hypothetical protein
MGQFYWDLGLVAVLQRHWFMTIVSHPDTEITGYPPIGIMSEENR